jgi:transcription initiation factor TFIIB
MRRRLQEVLETQESKGHSHSVIYDYENGEKICSHCGIVIKDKIVDAELDNDYFKATSDTNTILPYSLSLYNQGISTTIADYCKSKSKESSTSQQMHNKIEFLNKIVNYSNEKRNLKIAIDILNRLKDKINLNAVCVEEAFSYYRKALDSGLIKGRSIKEMIIACVYITCKKIYLPRTLSEISKIVDGNEVFAARCYRILTREFKIVYTQIDPVLYLHKIANESKISERTTRKALDTLIAIRKNQAFIGKDPLSVAAAILYSTCRTNKEKISQSKIAHSANINIITLRKRLSEIKSIFGDISLLSNSVEATKNNAKPKPMQMNALLIGNT